MEKENMVSGLDFALNQSNDRSDVETLNDVGTMTNTDSEFTTQDVEVVSFAAAVKLPFDSHKNSGLVKRGNTTGEDFYFFSTT